MNNILTLDQILDLPNQVMKNSNEHCDFAEIIINSICNEYNTKELKDRITKMFVKFKNVKYFYNFSIETSIKLTSVYDIQEGTRQRSNISKQESAVTRSFDNMIWAARFYDSIIVVSKKLTNQEATYLVSSLIGNKSEDTVAEMLAVCRKTLQHIKKSCLIKLWSELETLEDDN